MYGNLRRCTVLCMLNCTLNISCPWECVDRRTHCPSPLYPRRVPGAAGRVFVDSISIVTRLLGKYYQLFVDDPLPFPPVLFPLFDRGFFTLLSMDLCIVLAWEGGGSDIHPFVFDPGRVLYGGVQ